MNWLALWLLCWAALVGGPAWAQATDSDTDTDAEDGIIDNIAAITDPLVRMKVTAVADGIVRDSEWSSMHVRLVNLGDAVTGELVVRTRTPAGEDLLFRRRVELPAGARKDVSLLYQPGIGGASRVVDWVAGTRSVRANVPLRFVGRDDVAIGVIGEDTGGLQVIRDTWGQLVPARQPVERLDYGDGRKVNVGLTPVEALPDRVQGFDALNWLVWLDADPTALSAEQAEALQGWVAGGGHLLLTVTERYRQVGEGPLSDMMPTTLEGTRDNYGAWALLGRRTTTGGTLAPQAQARPRERPGRHVEVLTTDGADAIWTIGSFGLGTVHVVTVDPRLEPLRSGVDRQTLWRRLLWLPPTDATEISPVPLGEALSNAMDITDSADPSEAQDHLMMNGEDDTGWIGQVKAFLNDIPGVAPIPMTWLLTFAGIYLFVIGPLDYFVLRSLRRQPLTWITFPVSIAVFSGLALLGTSYVKGSQAVVTRFEVVDILPGADRWRGASWYGVWSTRSVSLSMTSGVGDGLAEPLENGGYQKNVKVEHGTAGSALEWDADTWTLSYARTTWTERNPGTIGVRVLGDGSLEVINNTGVDLHEAVVIVDKMELYIGELPSGGPERIAGLSGTRYSQDPYPSEALELTDQYVWARKMATFMPENGRGLMRFDGYDGVVVGVADEPLEDSVLEGLTPSPRILTVLRAPVSFSGPTASERP